MEYNNENINYYCMGGWRHILFATVWTKIKCQRIANVNLLSIVSSLYKQSDYYLSGSVNNSHLALICHSASLLS